MASASCVPGRVAPWVVGGVATPFCPAVSLHISHARAVFVTLYIMSVVRSVRALRVARVWSMRCLSVARSHRFAAGREVAGRGRCVPLSRDFKKQVYNVKVSFNCSRGTC